MNCDIIFRVYDWNLNFHVHLTVFVQLDVPFVRRDPVKIKLNIKADGNEKYF
jgi:hypothetical protein